VKGYLCVVYLSVPYSENRLSSLAWSYVYQNSSICVPGLMHIHAVTHLYVCLPQRLIHVCAKTHAYTCHDSFICVPATVP